ncbi:substrate-binding domain-containing protein [Flavobacterium sp.]|uniref:PstS family phosphate ABC transporter substrate-binding protein n=1 Tax=Flavobacterium sp. TaxID=239 RepID=UPI0028BE08D5|nr:substrate-binding domain-containing protein [Flavobacterium sp.]
MNRSSYFVLGVFALILFFSCDKKSKEVQPEEIAETAVAGSTTILVDETIFPIVEDLATVFESEYRRAKVNLVALPEADILEQIKVDKARIAILARDLDTTEVVYYNQQKHVFPRRTQFAVDAIAFIGNKAIADSVLTKNNLVDLMKGNMSGNFQALVFDNPYSSNLRELYKLADISELPKQGVFSMKSNKEVVKYVSEHKNAVGIVGVNWLLQPSNDVEPYVKNVKVLAVENVKVTEKNKYFKPNQTNIADGTYPVQRKLFLINFQGATGLGMGFASYIAGDKGQRIVLKSGLVPKKFPTREIAVRDKVEK